MKEIQNGLKDFFKKLEFEESSHSYYVDGRKLFTSVSGIVAKFYPAFDTENHSRRVAKKRGITQDEVKAEWKHISDVACERGDKFHKYAEDYATDRDLLPTTPLEDAIGKFWVDYEDKYEVVTVELKMFYKNNGDVEKEFGGMLDLLLVNKETGGIVIADYKTNKDLYKNFMGQRLYPPFQGFLDSPFNKYQLQLSLYQILFEQTGVKIEDRFIIWVKDDGTYEVLHTADLTEQLRKEI